MTFVGGVIWWIVFGALLGWVAAWWIGRSSQRLLAEPVIQIVERRVDNPQHLARIATLAGQVESLEGEAARIPALQARIDELVATPPRVVEKLVTRTVERVVEKPVERIVERVVPDPVAIADRDRALLALRLRIEHLEARADVLAGRIAAAPAAAAGALAAEAAGVAEAPGAVGVAGVAEPAEPGEAAGMAGMADAAEPGPSDIELVEGIGPKIAELLRDRGLGTFSALAQSTPAALRAILDEAGPAYRIADPGTWPEQARLAADGHWDELKSLQASLDAGRR
jgi:predicted flap endonuclease-1-like 5' DNA nuclease